MANAQNKPQKETSGTTPVPTIETNSAPAASPSGMLEEINATQAAIVTDKGTITIELFPDVAPNTVKNFLNKAKSGFYNNLKFHRVEDWVVQGGDPLGNGTGGGSIPVEFNNKPYGIGAVGVASRGDGKTQNDAQFFITKKDSQFLNGQYTNFGQVTSGMDAANKLEIGDKILKIDLQ